MGFLVLLPFIIFKNLKRMIGSKVSMVILFFMPLSILLIIGGAYKNVGDLSIDIGFVSVDNSLISENLYRALEPQHFNILKLDSVDRCTVLLKQGKVDACIELVTSGGKVEMFFYVDYSKINLVHIIVPLLSRKVEEESEGLRLVFVESLSEKMGNSLRNVQDIKKDYTNAFSEFGQSSNSLEGITQSLKSSKDSISSARASLEDTEKKSYEIYSETSGSVQTFEKNLKDIKERLSSQKSAVGNLLAYNQGCRSDYIPYILTPGYNLSSAPEDETIEMLKQYGKCKCVDYYRSNLESIDHDLNIALNYVNDAQLEVKDTELRNKEFYNFIKSSMEDNKVGLDELEQEKDEASKRLQEFSNRLSYKLDYFKGSLGNVESSFQNLSLEANLSSDSIVKPILVTVKPVSIEREVVVYLFPVLYFFIIMFIALLFSSTFTHSERSSYATSRNVVSPLGWLTQVFGLYISLLLVVVIQAAIMLVLGNYFFSLAIPPFSFLEIGIVGFFFLSLFILLGIFIGYFFKSQLVIMLIDISFSTFVFLYSNVIRPEEMMPAIARYVVSVNPFVLASSSVSKIILYQLGINWSSIQVIVFESLVLILFIYTLRNKFKLIS